MKKVAVVTVNFNSEQATKELLESIEKVKAPDLSVEVIIVDNGSEKAFVLNDKKERENTTVIRSGVNTGFTGGNNIGIKEALKRQADFVLLINNDTLVHPDLVINLFNFLESDKKIGVVVPKIYFSKGNEFHKDRYKVGELGRVIWFAGGYMDWKNAKSVHRGMDEVDHGQFDLTEKIDFATGCCMMIKKEVLEKTGLFDDRYFLYYEDADLSQKIINSGFEIYYVPNAHVYHKNAQSSGGSGSSLHDYFLTRNQMLFGLSYAPLKTKVALFRQSLNLLFFGRKYQKKGIQDYYLRKFGKGTFFVAN